jgi:hypothetical protein
VLVQIQPFPLVKNKKRNRREENQQSFMKGKNNLCLNSFFLFKFIVSQKHFALNLDFTSLHKFLSNKYLNLPTSTQKLRPLPELFTYLQTIYSSFGPTKIIRFPKCLELLIYR